MKVIVVTEQQIKEAGEETFSYLDASNDMNPNGNEKEITADGQLSDKEYGNPVTTDKIGKTITNQCYGSYGYMWTGRMRESTDKDGDGIDDFYNNSELDILSNGNSNDDLVKIPEGVDYKVNNLVTACQNLSPKQKAIVLNRFIESFDLNEVPYSWKKEMILKIRSAKNNAQAGRHQQE
jgi:hypothetical protein